jgi:hypothetical protein
VQPEFLFVDSKDTPKCNQSEILVWMQTFAIEQMNKAGLYIDKKPKETDLGGMKLAHVRLPSFSLFLLLMRSPTFRLQTYRSRVEGGYLREQFHCPFRKKCDCLFAISVKTYPDKVMLFVSGEHTADSHKGGKGLLTVKQQHTIRTAVKWQIQGHWDGEFNWCNKDFGLLAFGLNRMGAHYNPVTITIANSESRTAYEHSFESAEAAFFSLYKSTRICSNEEC